MMRLMRWFSCVRRRSSRSSAPSCCTQKFTFHTHGHVCENGEVYDLFEFQDMGRKIAWKYGTALRIPYMPLSSIFVPMTDQSNCGDVQADSGQTPVWCNIKVVWVRPGPGLERIAWKLARMCTPPTVSCS